MALVELTLWVAVHCAVCCVEMVLQIISITNSLLPSVGTLTHTDTQAKGKIPSLPNPNMNNECEWQIRLCVTRVVFFLHTACATLPQPCVWRDFLADKTFAFGPIHFVTFTVRIHIWTNGITPVLILCAFAFVHCIRITQKWNLSLTHIPIVTIKRTRAHTCMQTYTHCHTYKHHSSPAMLMMRTLGFLFCVKQLITWGRGSMWYG